MKRRHWVLGVGCAIILVALLLASMGGDDLRQSSASALTGDQQPDAGAAIVIGTQQIPMATPRVTNTATAAIPTVAASAVLSRTDATAKPAGTTAKSSGTTSKSASTAKPAATPTAAPPTATVQATTSVAVTAVAVSGTQFTVATKKGETVVTGTVQSSEHDSVLEMVNQERKKAGLDPLTYDDSLQAAAELRAVEASVSWSHTRPDGSKWNTVATGINGENLASGHRDAKEVMKGWMASKGHKDNILHEDFTRIAIACVRVGGTNYWVQLFGR